MEQTSLAGKRRVPAEGAGVDVLRAHAKNAATDAALGNIAGERRALHSFNMHNPQSHRPKEVRASVLFLTTLVHPQSHFLILHFG